MLGYFSNLKVIPAKKLWLAAFLSSVLIGLSIYSFIMLKHFSTSLSLIQHHNSALNHLYSLRNSIDSLVDLPNSTSAIDSFQRKALKLSELKESAISDLDALISMDISSSEIVGVKSNLTKLIDVGSNSPAQNGFSPEISPEIVLASSLFRSIDSLYIRHVTEISRLTEKNQYELKALYFSVSLNFLVIGIFIVLFYIKSTKEAITFEEVSNSLTKAVDKSDLMVDNLSIMSELSVYLQASPDFSAAKSVAATYGNKLFESYYGAYYTVDNDLNLLRLTFSWGDFNFDPSIPMTNCWGISTKLPHIVESSKSSAFNFSKMSFDSSYICIPVEVRGAIEGLFILKDSTYNTFEPSFIKLVESYANHICLGLSNIKLRDNLKDLSIKDPLTGLYNRRFMEETLTKYIRASQRNLINLAVLIIDVDFFKRINDTYGHDGGDYVLRELADTFNALVRANDIVCRFGGEEFVIVLHDMDFEDALIKAESFRSVVESSCFQYQNKIISPITVSIGVACYGHHGKNPDELIKAADTALYSAKNSGRNKVEIAS